MLEQADAAAREHNLTPFSAVQNEYSLLVRDPETDGVLDACVRLGVSFVPYFPLASGLLTGKYTRDGAHPAGARLSDREELATDAQWTLIEALSAYASARGLSMTQVAIGWLLAQPAVCSVICGATKPEQVAANAAAAAWIPSDSDVLELAGLLAG
jgi:aryl-alcohol dehydrogenase-like predicted oxidoreductase